jgi:putative membrane protein
MVEFVLHIGVTSLLVLLVAKIVDGFEVKNWGAALMAALALGLVNGFVRPLMVLLTLPITVLTLGLFLLVINALMLWLAAAIVPGVRIKGFGSAFFGALLLSIFNLMVSWLPSL